MGRVCPGPRVDWSEEVVVLPQKLPKQDFSLDRRPRGRRVWVLVVRGRMEEWWCGW